MKTAAATALAIALSFGAAQPAHAANLSYFIGHWEGVQTAIQPNIYDGLAVSLSITVTSSGAARIIEYIAGYAGSCGAPNNDVYRGEGTGVLVNGNLVSDDFEWRCGANSIPAASVFVASPINGGIAQQSDMGIEWAIFQKTSKK